MDPARCGATAPDTPRDCGATWTKINTGRNGDELDTGSQWVVEIDPQDPMVIYAGNLYGRNNSSLFKSTNGGTDWDNLFPAGSVVATGVHGPFFQDVDIDPTDSNHLVVSFHDQCRHPDDPPDSYTWMCLGESMDAGATWTLIDGPLDSWGEASGPYVIGGSEFLYAAIEGGIWYTNDDAAHWEQVGPGATLPPYRAHNGNLYIPTLYGIRSSSDGHQWAQVPSAPNSVSISGDGQRMFSAQSGPPHNPGDPPAYVATAEDGATTWAEVPAPTGLTARIVNVAVDRDHHVLYSANSNDGLFRMVTY